MQPALLTCAAHAFEFEAFCCFSHVKGGNSSDTGILGADILELWTNIHVLVVVVLILYLC